MKSILLPCILCLSVPLSAQEWNDVYHFNPEQTLQKIRFHDPSLGLTVGSLYNGSTNNIHRTTNGGKTWTDHSSGYTGMRFMDIFYVEDSVVFMSGNDGLILRSLDGGRNWVTLKTGTSEQLWGLWFQSRKIGFAVGSNGIILRTTNGGTVWDEIPSGVNNLLYDVVFTPSGKGFASGSNILLQTENGGDSWSPVTGFPFKAPADWIRSMRFLDDNNGFACADIGRIYRTTDGGNSWERLNSPTTEALFDIDFLDHDHGLICGFNGTILRTSNGGDAWLPMSSPLGNEHLYSVDITSSGEAYICTHFGHILKLQKLVNTNDWQWTEVELFPNPTQDYINLRFLFDGDLSRKLHYEISDLSGRIEIQGEADSNSEPISVKPMPPGNYIVKVFDKKHFATQSIQLIKH